MLIHVKTNILTLTLDYECTMYCSFGHLYQHHRKPLHHTRERWLKALANFHKY